MSLQKPAVPPLTLGQFFGRVALCLLICPIALVVVGVLGLSAWIEWDQWSTTEMANGISVSEFLAIRSGATEAEVLRSIGPPFDVSGEVRREIVIEETATGKRDRHYEWFTLDEPVAASDAATVLNPKGIFFPPMGWNVVAVENARSWTWWSYSRAKKGSADFNGFTLEFGADGRVESLGVPIWHD